MAVMATKKKKKLNESREAEKEIQLESTIIQKKPIMFNSSSTPLSFYISRAYISKTDLHIILGKPKT